MSTDPKPPVKGPTDDGAEWLKRYEALKDDKKSEKLTMLDQRESELGSKDDASVPAQRAWIANERNRVQALPD